MENKIKVMLTTEGTYPYYSGGVSTWCEALVKNLKNVEYLVYSIIMNPYVNQKFKLPEGSKLIAVPLWGVEEPFEHLNIPFTQVYRSKNQTTDEVVREEFIPIFREVVEEIVAIEKQPLKLGQLLLDMHNYFKKYDYKATFKSEVTWNSFIDIILGKASNKIDNIVQPTIFSVIQSLGWLYRFMSILCAQVPQSDIVHSAAAAFCGIPCVLSKLIYNTPYILTEHGVYMREQYLSLSKRGYDSYLNTFFIRMITSVVKLNYAYADQISPVCNYNTKWETKFGVMPDKIKVIYNGVDKDYFNPIEIKRDGNKFRIVTVARIDPVKDLITLIKAAAIIRDRYKETSFHVYGSVTVPQYYEECKEYVKKAGLSEHFIFEGNTDDTPSAYASGDVIVLSSITEAFPYSVVEAMMMGKPVVASDVGGISEALGEAGILVTPGKPEEFAEAVIKLLENAELRSKLGKMSRERTIKLFDINNVLNSYYTSYADLKKGIYLSNVEMEKIRRQNLNAEKGYAMLIIGDYKHGIEHLQAAINELPASLAVPVLLTKISEAYLYMGDMKNAENTMLKAKLIAGKGNNNLTA